MSNPSYFHSHANVDFSRSAGVLTARLHTEGGALRWLSDTAESLRLAFADAAEDEENRVVIVTGTGASFCDELDFDTFEVSRSCTPMTWERNARSFRGLIEAIFSIPVPVVAAVNGPATIHAEIALLSDVVISSPEAEFRDAPHFPRSVVPGDGAQVLWPLLLGQNRGRYFLLMGETLSAEEALELGVVSEIVERDHLAARAEEIAAYIGRRSYLTLRYTRAVLVDEFRRKLMAGLNAGLSLEGLANIQLLSFDSE